MQKLACMVLAIICLMSGAVKAEEMSAAYNFTMDNSSDNAGVFMTDGQVDYMFMPVLTGYAGFSNSSAVSHAQALSIGGGVEMPVTKKLSLRFDYQHTVWQANTLASVDMARISPDDDALRAVVVYRFK